MITNLRKLRNEFGISQQQLGDSIMASQQSINKYENHDVEPDIKTLIKIAEYFNVSIDYLVGRTEIKDIYDKVLIADLDENESQLIKKYRNLNEIQKNCVNTVIDSYK